MNLEIWKDIPNYEGLYQVSNFGNVKSLDRKVYANNGRIYNIKGIYLKLYKNNKGYYSVCLSENNVKKNIDVHQLVAMAFLNHKPCGFDLVIDHKNDNKLDNRVENLQIVTQRYNSHKKQGKYSSKYKGVHYAHDRNKWRACIQINGKLIHLGSFECELKASLVYQNKLKELSL